MVSPWEGALLRNDHAFQPPKEEKVENKEQLGLTTLFPGQKRRISHLSKQGKEVRVSSGVLCGGWREGKNLLFAEQSRWVPLSDVVQHSLCPGREVPGAPIQSELCSILGGPVPEEGECDADEPSPRVTLPSLCVALSCAL